MSARVILAGAVTVLMLAACGESEPAGIDQREPPRGFTTDEAAVARASNSFGLALLRQVHAGDSRANLMLSPLSASMALGMTLNGAAGGTWEAMRGTLGFAGMSEDEINAAYRGLIAQLLARDHTVEFRLANSVWHDAAFPIKQPFLDAAAEYFDAEVAGLDFDNQAASLGRINGWVDRQTGGRIEKILDYIDPLEIMFLVNAVYFKAPWSMTFETNATRSGPFRRADGSTVDVPLMNNDAAYLHFVNDEAYGVELLYGDSAFSMVLIAPAEGRTLDGLIGGLTPQRWQSWIDAFQVGRVMLTMPKFRFEYGTSLDDALKAMGMEIAFTPRLAEFPRIGDRDDIHISRVDQKTFIDVHEKGTEAAGVTVVGVGVTSMPPSVRFDKPFLVAIRERESGTLLFLGRVGDPSRS
jgi:serine protease inhibitor